jgi:hypothetical protein
MPVAPLPTIKDLKDLSFTPYDILKNGFTRDELITGGAMLCKYNLCNGVRYVFYPCFNHFLDLALLPFFHLACCAQKNGDHQTVSSRFFLI